VTDLKFPVCTTSSVHLFGAAHDVGRFAHPGTVWLVLNPVCKFNAGSRCGTIQVNAGGALLKIGSSPVLGLCPQSCKSGRLCGAPVNAQKGKLCFFHSEQLRRSGVRTAKREGPASSGGVEQPSALSAVQPTPGLAHRTKRQRVEARKKLMPSSVSEIASREIRSDHLSASVPSAVGSCATASATAIPSPDPRCTSYTSLEALVARLGATPSDHVEAVRGMLVTLQGSHFSSASARRAGLATALKKHRGHPPLSSAVVSALNTIRSNMDKVDSANPASSSDSQRPRPSSDPAGADVKQVMLVGSRLRCELASQSVSLLQDRLATIEAREALELERLKVRSVKVAASWCMNCRVYYDSFASVAKKHCESEGHSLVLKEAVTKRRWECDNCRASCYVLGQRAPADCFKCGASSWSWVSFYLPSRHQLPEEAKMQLTAETSDAYDRGSTHQVEHGYEGMYGGRQGFAD